MVFKLPALPSLSAKMKRKTDDRLAGFPVTESDAIQVLQTIGRGSYGVVKLCRTNDNKEVILKEMHEGDENLFYKEAKVMSSISHENIVKFDSFYKTKLPGSYSFIMEYVYFDFSHFGHESKVSSLKDFLYTTDLFECKGFEHVNTFIAKDICNGLVYLHEKDIVHRDLKPDNVLVSNQHFNVAEDLENMWHIKPLVAKLTDFGESRTTLIQTASLIHTRTTNLYRGSPVYMAPEIHLGNGKQNVGLQDLKSMDIWSLAMTLYMILNPDMKYPYETEMKIAQRTGASNQDILKDLLKKNAIPKHGEKYSHERNTNWGIIEKTFQACASFSDRPNARDTLNMLEDTHCDRNVCQTEMNPERQLSRSATDDKSCKVSDKKGDRNLFEDFVGDGNVCSKMSLKQDNVKETHFTIGIEKEGTREHQQKDIHDVRAYEYQLQNKVACRSILGNFHQASPNVFSHAAVGSQCSTICLVSIIASFSKPPSEWTSEDIDTVVTAGDQLHLDILKVKGWPNQRQETKVDIDELPTEVKFSFGHRFMHASVGTLNNIKCGKISEIDDLARSVILGSVKKNIILRIQDKCRSILANSANDISLFDPHACNKDGGVDADGAACIIHFNDIYSLIVHLKSLAKGSQNDQVDFAQCDVELLTEKAIDGENAGDIENDRNYPICTDNSRTSENSDVLSDDDSNVSTVNSTTLRRSEKNELGTETKPFIEQRKGRYRNTELNPSHWTDCAVREVEELPYDINGTTKFRIKANKDNIMKVSKDGRPWDKWMNSSRNNLIGIRRVARCKGSFQCLNPSCQYIVNYGCKNKLQFQSTGGVKVCFVCGVPAERVHCSAVKVWEFEKHSDSVVVMHKGLHTCVPKKVTVSKIVIKKAIEANPNSKPSKLVNDKLVNMMQSEFSWDEVEEVAEQFVDMKKVYNVRDEMKRDINPCGENFDALGLYKKKCDEKDTFFIYKMNNKSLNGNPSYVFKSSKEMAKLAILMDCDGDGILKEEYAFVDAKHDRTKGFKTITLWTYHPVARKLLCLAKMEVENESTENLILFWQIFNEMLQKCSDNKNYIFNPIGFVCDENHANWKGIEHVFGQTAINKTVSCEFHYKQSIQRQKKKIPEYGEEFTKLANSILEALTISEFETSCKELQSFIEKYPFLNHWFTWWYNRRTHIFKAFKPDHAPASNIAEIGHAKLQSVGRKYMSLLETAREDVVLAIRQDAELRSFASGMAPGGKGPSQKERIHKKYQRGLKRAVSFANELEEHSPILPPKRTFVPKSGKHRPQENLNHSPYPFHLVLYTRVRNLKMCYGCGKEFKDKFKNAPNDLILKNYCHRKYKDNHGNMKTSREPQAAYFHLKLDCARKVSPFMELSDVLIHDEIRSHLTSAHISVLNKFGLHP